MDSKLTAYVGACLFACGGPGCAPEIAGQSDTEGGSAEGTAETEESSGGGSETGWPDEEGPVVDCETDADPFDTPRWAWVGEPEERVSSDWAALSGGEFVSLEESALERWLRPGEPVWSLGLDTTVDYRALARIDDDVILLAGVLDSSQLERPLWLSTFSLDGMPLRHQETFPLAKGTEHPAAIAPLDDGRFAVLVTETFDDGNSHRIDVFGQDLQRETTFVPRPGPGIRTLAADGERIIVVTPILTATEPTSTSTPPLYTWETHVDAYNDAGELEWEWSRDVKLNTLLTPAVATGDPLVVQLLPTELVALEAGQTLWTLDFQDTPIIEVTALADDPCGGVFIGGRSLEGSTHVAGLGRVDVSGGSMSWTPLDEPTGLEDEFPGGTFQTVGALQVSPTGDVLVTGTVAAPAEPRDALAPWMRSY